MAHGLKPSFKGSEINGATSFADVDSLIFDVSYIAHRHANALSRMQTSEGARSGHVYGVFKQIRAMVWAFKPKNLVFAYDRPMTWRSAIVSSYKEDRRPKDADPNAWTPAPEVERLLRSFPGYHLSAEDAEADDMVAWYVANNPPEHRAGPIAIVSADRDLFQLVNDTDDVAVIISKKAKVAKSKNVDHWIREDEVAEEFGVLPKYVARVKALLGDASDSVEGLKGASRPGKKDALRLFASQPDADTYFDLTAPMPPFLFVPDWLSPELALQRDRMTANLSICDLKARPIAPACSTKSEKNIAQALDVLVEFECESLLSQVEPFFESIVV